MMDDTRRNAEGYPDPTAHEAIANIALSGLRRRTGGYRPLVYICSPYAGDVDGNVENARRYSRFACDRGCIPVTPHLLYPQFLDDGNAEDRRLGLFFGIVLLTKCEELWVFGKRLSPGMIREVAKAKGRGMPIRRFSDRPMLDGGRMVFEELG